MRTISLDTPASPAAHQARLARINASHASATALAARRARYYPAPAMLYGMPGCYDTVSGRFLTSDRPLHCTAPNAGRDTDAPSYYLDLTD